MERSLGPTLCPLCLCGERSPCTDLEEWTKVYHHSHDTRGVIYDEFERELSRFRELYADAPRRELIALFLLALEREEIVSVAYREEAIAARLARMPIADDLRALIRHALLWAWKDEEMHAIYIRGAIFRAGGFLLRSIAYARQMGGAVGGWAASVRQHARWRDAPVSRLAATALTVLGGAAGKIPAAVRRTLDYGSFRAFCLYNIDAEKTAARCWQRIAGLAARDPSFTPELIRDFDRIALDEARHQRVFEILYEALDDNDHITATDASALLVSQLRGVGDDFLPRAFRSDDHPIGSGSTVQVVRGNSEGQKIAMFENVVRAAGLQAILERAAMRTGKRVQELSVAVKPTFMLGYDRRDRSVITDPELVEHLARMLNESGCTDIAVIEGPNIYDHFYRHRSVKEVAHYFGYESPLYHVVDAAEEQVAHQYSRGFAQHRVAKSWRDADVRISFPRMRSHPIELAYLSVANVEWIGGRCDDYIFCERQAQRETTIMMLLDDFPPHLALIDAYDLAADGLVGVMGCPRPKSPRRFYAGTDALAVDIVAARHMGVTEPRESSVLRAAMHWFGEHSKPAVVAGCDEPIEGWRGPYHTEMSALLSVLAHPVYVGGSGRGALFVPEMDETAFPPIAVEKPLLRFSRSAIRRLIGLHHP